MAQALCQKVWKFVFAMQQPLHVCFSMLRAQKVCDSAEPVSAANWSRLQRVSCKRRFSVDYESNIPGHALPPCATELLDVLPGLEHSGGHLLESSQAWVPSEKFVESWPALPRAGGGWSA